MANEQNLRPFTSDQSREEAAKNGKKGGINSGKSRRKRRRMRELAEMTATLPASKIGKDYYNDFFELEEDNIDNEMVFMAHLWEDAYNGVESARRTLLRLLGEDDELDERIRSNRANEKIRMKEIESKQGQVPESTNENDIRNANIKSICDIIMASGQTGLKEGD